MKSFSQFFSEGISPEEEKRRKLNSLRGMYGTLSKYEKGPSDLEQQDWLDQETEADYPDVDPSISPEEDYEAAMFPPKKRPKDDIDRADDYYHTKSYRAMVDPEREAENRRDVTKQREEEAQKVAEKKLDEDWADWQKLWNERDEADARMQRQGRHHKGYFIADDSYESSMHERGWVRWDELEDRPWTKFKYDLQDIPWDEYEELKEKRRARIREQYSGYAIGDRIPSRAYRETPPWKWSDVI